MGKVGCAINGVDDPFWGIFFPFNLATFFHDKAPFRACFIQLFLDSLFCINIGSGDKISGTFAGDLQIFHFTEIAHHASAGSVCCFVHHIDEGRTTSHDKLSFESFDVSCVFCFDNDLCACTNVRWYHDAHTIIDNSWLIG